MTQATALVLGPGHGHPLNVLGDRQTVKVTGEDTGGAFALVENHNPPGVGIPMHLHRHEDETFYVVEGDVRFTVDGEQIEAGPGTTVFLPRGTPHAFEVVGDGPARMLILLAPAGLEGLFRELAALDGPPDPAALAAACGPYGIEFLAPDA